MIRYPKIWTCPVHNDGDGDYVAIIYVVFEEDESTGSLKLLQCNWQLFYL